MNNKNISLAKVIQRFKFIADNEFEGKIYDNVLLIFNQLNMKERTILLRGLVNMMFIVEDQVLMVGDAKLDSVKQIAEQAIKKTSDSIESEIQDMNAINQLELMKLRSWAFKVGVTVLILSGAVVLGCVLLASKPGTGGEMFESFTNVIKIVKMMVGL